MDRAWQTRVVAMLSIAAIEVAAIFNGMNGHMMALSLALIGGIAGYSVGLFRRSPRSVDDDS